VNTASKLGGYGLMLGAAFAVALGVGTAVGPVSATTTNTATASTHPGGGQDAQGMSGMTATDYDAAGAHGMAGTGHAGGLPQGLAAAAGGYTLAPATTMLPTGRTAAFSFRVLGPDGTPLTAYTAEHERELHFIVVGRDLIGYQHLHPTRSADGTWSVPLTLPAAGVYKAFADFRPVAASMPVTLAVDLFAPGDFRPAPLPKPVRTTTVDGYVVTLAGTPAAARESGLRFTVERDGRPVTDLQPYLGAYGHLVALRVGDLAYSHVHPDGAPGDGRTAPGPAVVFHADLPTAGAYRLFLDFQTRGVVHTAAFTATAGR